MNAIGSFETRLILPDLCNLPKLPIPLPKQTKARACPSGKPPFRLLFRSRLRLLAITLSLSIPAMNSQRLASFIFTVRPFYTLARVQELSSDITAFIGTTLLTLAEVFTQEPRLADPSEPSPQVINAKSIDFFEKALQGCQGEYETEISSPVGSKGNAKKRMDWKLEIAWGRALVSLARQKLEDGDEEEEEMEELGKKKKPTKARGLMGNKKRAREPEPVVPLVAAKTPVYKLSPKQLLVHAADHFQLGILHMPRPFPSLFDPSEQYKDPITSLNSTINHRQRLRTLLDIASSVSPLAEKFTDPRERSKWAVWSNGIFDQVDTESPVRLQSAQGQDDDWKFEVALGRGGVWLGVGSRLVEDLEQGDEGEVDEKKKAEAREMVQRSLKFLAEARKMRPRASETALEGSAEGEKEDEVAPLLVEAYLTLSGLVGDEEEGEVERLEELAREEGWVEEDEEDDEDMSVDGDD